MPSAVEALKGSKEVVRKLLQQYRAQHLGPTAIVPN